MHRMLFLSAIVAAAAACRGASLPQADVDAGADALSDASRAACAPFAPATAAGVVTDSLLTELSGLASSRLSEGILWAHDDSGDHPAVLFALREDGTAAGRLALEGATDVDWEDLALGPDPDRDELFLADIGDNGRARTSLVIYRVVAPEVPATGLPADARVPVASMTFHYEDGPRDAEALFVEPAAGELFVISKETGTAGVYRVGTFAAGSDVTAHRVKTLDFDTVTAADMSPDGRELLVRSYTRIRHYSRALGESVVEALGHEPCFVALARGESLGEAIAFSRDASRFFTAADLAGFGATTLYVYHRR